MICIPFGFANASCRHPALLRAVPWRTTSGEDYIVFEAQVGESFWSLRLNDFPDKPCWTLLIDGDEVAHFDEWPNTWSRPYLDSQERLERDAV